MGVCLTFTGEVVEGQAHFDRALKLYDPEAHRPLATRFTVDSKGADVRLSFARFIGSCWLSRSRACGTQARARVCA